MDAMQKADRRRHARHPLSTAVRLHHDQARLDFPARCVDISESGLMMYVPISTPVKAGQTVRLTMSGIKEGKYVPLNDQPMEAMIVRVARHGLLKIGRITVAVEFIRQ